MVATAPRDQLQGSFSSHLGPNLTCDLTLLGATTGLVPFPLPRLDHFTAMFAPWCSLPSASSVPRNGTEDSQALQMELDPAPSTPHFLVDATLPYPLFSCSPSLALRIQAPPYKSYCPIFPPPVWLTPYFSDSF